MIGHWECYMPTYTTNNITQTFNKPIAEWNIRDFYPYFLFLNRVNSVKNVPTTCPHKIFCNVYHTKICRFRSKWLFGS